MRSVDQLPRIALMRTVSAAREHFGATCRAIQKRGRVTALHIMLRSSHAIYDKDA